MRRILLAILIFMSASLALHARYGETLEQLEARFGKGSKAVLTPNDKNIFDAINGFKKNDVNITAYMIDGKCERITYNNAKVFTEEEITNLLEANKLNSSWTPLPTTVRADGKKDPLPKKCWQNKDLKLFAERYTVSSSDTLLILSAKYIEKEQQFEKKMKETNEKAKNANKVEGF